MLLQPELFLLLREYCSLVPARFLSVPKAVSFLDLNTFLVEGVLLNPHLQNFPPAKQYQKSFWKALIGHLEELQRASDDDVEIDDRILEYYLTLLPPGAPTSGSSQANLRDQICGLGLPIREPPGKSFITHFWTSEPQPSTSEVDSSLYETTTLQESQSTIEGGTTGLRTWAASLRLAEYLIAHPDIIVNKRILELGSGIGFLGIIVSILQQRKTAPAPIWLTDVNDEVLAQCRRNLSLECNLSSTHPEVHYRALDWFEALDDDHTSINEFLDESDPEIVLGADIVFDPSLIEPLVALLYRILQGGRGRVAFVALTIRKEDTFGKFLEVVSKYGITTEEIAIPSPDEKPNMFLETVEGQVAQNKILRLTR